MQLLEYLILIPLTSFICYCILFIVLLSSRKNKVTKYYSFYIVTMIIWSLGSFMMRTSFYPGPLFWNRILCVGLIMTPVIFYHFTLVLTDTINDKFRLFFGYVFAVCLIIVNFFGLIVKEVYAVNNLFYYTLGPLAAVMAVWSLSYLFLAFFTILGKVKSGKISFSKVKFILYGLILVIIGGLINLVPAIGKYPFDFILNTVNAFFIVYSIIRFKFLEINIILKKGIAYSIYTLILAGIFIIAIFPLEKVLRQTIGPRAAVLVMAVLLAMAFQPIKNVIYHWIDFVFYRNKRNLQALLKDFSNVINNILDLDELIDSLLRMIVEGIKPKKVTLMLKYDKQNYQVFQYCDSYLKVKSLKEVQYPNNHPIIQWFIQKNSILTMIEIETLPFFAGLWSAEKEQLYKMETELIVPIKLREQFIGMLILSEKKAGDAYSQEEIDLVYTLMNNAAVVIDNAKMYIDLKQQAITDGLTKLYNHRYFHEVLRRYIHEGGTDVFSVAIIDVDLFKLYNDLYGHSAGDKALVTIAEVLKQSTTREDCVARYGGEEFAVIFPNLEGNESLQAIEKIRKAVENKFVSSNDTNEFLTVSIGVATFPQDAESSEELLECADSAMYVAKRSGRNNCVLYSKQKQTHCTVDQLDQLQEMQENIKSAYIASIYALAATIDAKDHYTYGHSENVSNYAVALAEAAGFDEDRIDTIKNAGLLHDIGKIGIPESILTKTESLTSEEYDTMKKHVDISITIIKHVPNLIKVIPAIMSHHEKYDGTGYPRGIKGESIPIEGRCLCLVDAFDAMTTDRPYRKALSPKEAISEIKKYKGIQFDPKLCDIFIRLFEEGKIKTSRAI